MELLDHMIVLVLFFWGNFILFSVVVAPIYILTNGAQGPLFSTSLPILLFPVFLVIAILTSLRCWFIVGLIYISLMVSDVEHLFMCLLDIFGKMSIQILCPFLKQIIYFFFIGRFLIVNSNSLLILVCSEFLFLND